MPRPRTLAAYSITSGSARTARRTRLCSPAPSMAGPLAPQRKPALRCCGDGTRSAQTVLWHQYRWPPLTCRVSAVACRASNVPRLCGVVETEMYPITYRHLYLRRKCHTPYSTPHPNDYLSASKRRRRQITECTQKRSLWFVKTLRPNAYWEMLQTNLVQSLSTHIDWCIGSKQPQRQPVEAVFRHGKPERVGCVGTKRIMTSPTVQTTTGSTPATQAAATPSYSPVEERK